MNNHKETLEILKPMHGGSLDNYMFTKYLELNGSHFLMGAPNFEKVFWKDYIPSFEQVWDEILKFNDEQKKYKVEIDLPIKCIALKVDVTDTDDTDYSMFEGLEHLDKSKIKFESWANVTGFKYTDTSSMYLALLKICVEIWKIKQVEAPK